MNTHVEAALAAGQQAADSLDLVRSDISRARTMMGSRSVLLQDLMKYSLPGHISTAAADIQNYQAALQLVNPDLQLNLDARYLWDEVMRFKNQTYGPVSQHIGWKYADSVNALICDATRRVSIMQYALKKMYL